MAMKKQFHTKYLTMILFLLLLTGIFLQNLSALYEGARQMGYSIVKFGIVNSSLFESAYNEGFTGKNTFITANGAIQRLFGASVVNERVRLHNGHLTYTIDEYDMQELAQHTVDFRDVLEDMDIPFVYVNAPFKIHRTDKQLPVSVEDYSNENADCFLSYLKDAGVTTLDLRDSIDSENIDHYSMFYKTDHHWTAEAGLWAAGKITDFLAAQNADFAVEKSLADPGEYNYTRYENIFMGSAGKRVGPLFINRDDFTLVTPKFETNLTFNVDAAGLHREGDFEDVFLFMQHLYSEDPYSSNTYLVYCNSYFDTIEITNSGVGEDAVVTDKKILLIRDSYSDVLIPFLSLAYAQTHVVDLRVFEDDLVEYIKDYDPDIVLVAYNPGAYEDNNRIMFDYLK